MAAALGDQQADHRGRPVRRRRGGLRRGLVAGEAVLPHRPADGDRRRHARHRRAGPQLRRARPPPQRAGVGDGQRRRLRPQAAHAVPVVRAGHRCRAAAQDRPAALGDPARAGHVNLKWHDPAATVAEGIASRGDRRIGRVIERVWRAGGTFQEWGEHFDLRRWTDAMEAEGLSLDWYVHRHRAEDEVLPWDHLTAGLHRDFLWDDWQAALAAGAVQDCRWTPCYDCGVCTGYGIEHVVASPVPPAGGSQGTGQDLERGGVLPGARAVRSPAAAVGVLAMRLRVRYAKLGKVRFTSHRDTARIWERAMRKARLPVDHERRVHAPAAAQLRPGAADRGGVDRRVPRRRARRRGRAVDVGALPERLTDALPGGFTALLAAEHDGGRSLQDEVTSVTWELEVPAGVRRRARRSSACWRPTSCRSNGSARASGASTTSARRSCRWLSAPDGTRLVAELATVGRGLRPAELAAVAFPGAAVAALRVLRTHQWIEHDGNRRPRSATSWWRCRTPCRRPWWAHEKGTSWTTTTRGRTPRPARRPAPAGDVAAGARAVPAGDAGADVGRRRRGAEAPPRLAWRPAPAQAGPARPRG